MKVVSESAGDDFFGQITGKCNKVVNALQFEGACIQYFVCQAQAG
jgi:hypothetical protein